MESSLSPALSPIAPVRPAAAYIGGKRILAKRLTALIEATPHVCYAEAFVGMGGVFFRRRVGRRDGPMAGPVGGVAGTHRRSKGVGAPSPPPFRRR